MLGLQGLSGIDQLGLLKPDDGCGPAVFIEAAERVDRDLDVGEPGEVYCESKQVDTCGALSGPIGC